MRNCADYKRTITRAKPRKLYIESYGCQMNFSDSEIVASIFNKMVLIRHRTSTRQM